MMISTDKGADMASMEHHKALPDEIVEFLDVTDETDDRPTRSEEELALRPIPDSPRAALDDPALREFDSGGALPPASWFADEEPEPPYKATDDDDVEAVDELLAAQHYLFEDESERPVSTEAEEDESDRQ
jgi:hypothetical protein